MLFAALLGPLLSLQHEAAFAIEIHRTKLWLTVFAEDARVCLKHVYVTCWIAGFYIWLGYAEHTT